MFSVFRWQSSLFFLGLLMGHHTRLHWLTFTPGHTAHTVQFSSMCVKIDSKYFLHRKAQASADSLATQLADRGRHGDANLWHQGRLSRLDIPLVQTLSLQRLHFIFLDAVEGSQWDTRLQEHQWWHLLTQPSFSCTCIWMHAERRGMAVPHRSPMLYLYGSQVNYYTERSHASFASVFSPCVCNNFKGILKNPVLLHLKFTSFFFKWEKLKRCKRMWSCMRSALTLTLAKNNLKQVFCVIFRFTFPRFYVTRMSHSFLWQLTLQSLVESHVQQFFLYGNVVELYILQKRV